MAIAKCSGVGTFLALAGLVGGALAGPEPGKTEPPSAEVVAVLIDQLGSMDFGVREQASEQLMKLGAPILPALRKAAQGRRGLEAQRRLEIVINRIENAILGAEEKLWQALPVPRGEMKDRVEKILSRTPALSDQQLTAALYLLTLGRSPTAAEEQEAKKQFGGSDGRRLRVFQFARALVQDKGFLGAVAVANSRLIQIQNDLAREPDVARKIQLLGANNEAVLKIASEAAAALPKATKTDARIADLAFLLTLSRYPTAGEAKGAAALLERSADRPRAFADLFWALVNSKEFLMLP